MKTLGRILIILAVFILIMRITYTAVNANASSSTASTFERGEGSGMQPRFSEGERQDFDRDRAAGGDWMFGMIKNTGIVAVIVSVVVIPKRWMRRTSVDMNLK